jgi:hypothetical protein
LCHLSLEFTQGLFGAGVRSREAPAAVLAIQGGPDPEEGPDGVQGEETDPSLNVQEGILLGVVAVLGDFLGDVVDGYDPVEDHDGDEEENAQGKIIEKHAMTPDKGRSLLIRTQAILSNARVLSRCGDNDDQRPR